MKPPPVKLRVLRLTVKKKWFDMIVAGIKWEEYREMKAYWNRRLAGRTGFDAVEFVNGYGKTRPRILMSLEGITIGQGRKDWGAPVGDVYILHLGNVINGS